MKLRSNLFEMLIKLIIVDRFIKKYLSYFIGVKHENNYCNKDDTIIKLILILLKIDT